MAEKAFIAVGSNIEPERNLPIAVDLLRGLGRVRSVSRVYQNPAIGSTPQPDYLNVTVLLETVLPPFDLRERLRAIEAQLGRVRTADRYAPRTIDLDLCLYGTLVMDSASLILPSPEIATRDFLAITLAELAPDDVHPATGEPLHALARRIPRRPNLVVRPDVVIPLEP